MITAATPRLLVGLGNPGTEYAQTRHNAGFWFCERLASELGARLAFESRFHGFAAHVREAELWLLMPQTYMNRSGQSIGALARFYRILPDEILIVHDELDLPPGQSRLKFGGGLGGHNGLKDATAHLGGSQDYWRLRIGIGHPGDRREVVNYVLKPPRAEERAAIDETLDRALAAWPLIVRGDWEKAAQRLNTRSKPPAPSGPASKETP